MGGGLARARVHAPLDSAALAELAAGYAARYATTRAKLRRYLTGKLRMRGWAGAGVPDLDGVIERLVSAGAVNDAAWGEARTAALARRGYGQLRVGHALAAGGLDPDTRSELLETIDAVSAAEAYARRRRLGKFAATTRTEEELRRDMGAMLRAGHSWAATKSALGGAPDDE